MGGRIMDPYKVYLRYGDKCEIHGPADLQRSWGRADFMEKGAPCKNWGVVFEKKSSPDAKRMIDGLKQQAQKARLPGGAFNQTPQLFEVEMRRNVPREKC